MTKTKLSKRDLSRRNIKRHRRTFATLRKRLQLFGKPFAKSRARRMPPPKENTKKTTKWRRVKKRVT